MDIYKNIFRTSLNDIYTANVINTQNPNICIITSVFSFKGFLLIHSINNSTILTPSNGGNGSKLDTPKDNEIKEIILTYSFIPCVLDTLLDIPNWSHYLTS